MSGTVSFEDAMRETEAPREGRRSSKPDTVSFEDAMGGGNGWLPTAVVSGLSDVAGALGDIPTAIRSARRSLLEWGSPTYGAQANANLDRTPKLSDYTPGSDDISSRVHEVTGLPVEHAQTTPGKIAESAVRFGVGSALPIGGTSRLASAGRNALEGLAAGAVSEGAGQVTEGTVAEGPARIAGALAPAAAIGARRALSSNPLREDVTSALSSLKPEQAEAVAKLMADAKAAGTAITVPEAVQAVLGRHVPDLAAAQDFVQQSRGGRGVMSEFMGERDAGGRALIERQIAGLEPPATQSSAALPQADADTVRQALSGSPESAALTGPGPQAPAAMAGNQGLGMTVQTAAERELAAARTARSQAVRPLYEAAAEFAARPTVAPKVTAATDNLLTELQRIGASDQTGLITARTEKLIETLRDTGGNPITNWESIQDARKFIRDVTDGNITADRAIDRQVARRANTAVDNFTKELRQLVPPFQRADAEYQRLSRVVDTMDSGLVGGLSRTNNVSTQRGVLFPRSPEGGATPRNPAETGEAFGQIAGTSPSLNRRSVGRGDLEAARSLLASELNDAFETAIRPPKNGPVNSSAGPAFANRIAGTPNQRANLRAAFEALPGGKEAWEGFESGMLRYFDAQAYRPAGNSATYSRGETGRAMEQGGLRGLASAAASPLRSVAEGFDRLRREGASRDMARLLTDPEGFQTLRIMSRVDPSTRSRLAGELFARIQRTNQAEQATDQ